MSTNHLEPSDLKGFRHWVHPVLTLATAGLQGLSTATIRAAVQAFISDIQKMDRILKMACRIYTVLLSDLLENLPKNQKSQDQLWSAIKEALRLYFIVVVKDPASLRDLLPKDWGANGYPNVCFVLLTDDSLDRNRENIAVFKEIPARFRALWIDPQSKIAGIENLNVGIHWLIIDTCILAAGGTLTEDIQKWVNDFRDFGQSTKTPVFHNPPGCSGATLLEPQANFPGHPFPAGVDLHRPPISSNSSGAKESEKSTVPTPVEIAQLTSSVEALESTISQPVEIVHSSSGDPCIEVENLDSVSAPETNSEHQDSLSALPVNVEVISKKRARFRELNDVAKKGFGIFTVVGQAICEIREHELWREGNYPSWDAYCTSIIGLSKSYANRLIRDAEIASELQLGKMPKSSCGEPILPANESQVRPLAKLEHPTQRRKAWKIAVKRAEGQPTAAIVAGVVCELVAEESPPTPQTPSRKERRSELVCELRKVAEAESSWDEVRSICANLNQLL